MNRLFVNKIRKVSWCYSLEWSDSEIIIANEYYFTENGELE